MKRIRLPHAIDKITVKGTDYPVINRQVLVPDELAAEVRMLYPGAEELVGDPSNSAPATPATDGRNPVR